jgi:dolichyl-phosphate beta-glucosyltransferase
LSAPFLSIIIPAYNEERRMPVTLKHVLAFIEAQTYASEVIVVENGSQDRTVEIVQDFARQHAQVHLLQESARGKGLAVRRGMLSARGEYRFMCDADFSMPVTEINRFLPPQQVGADIVIASREAPGAVRYNEPAYRHLVGRVFNTLIRVLALPGLQDTQCGFKCFRANVAEDLFRRQTLSGWSFDVEVLFIARRLGYSIRELPIPWYFNPDSKIRVLNDSIHMGLDLLEIRRKARLGVYDRPQVNQA